MQISSVPVSPATVKQYQDKTLQRISQLSTQLVRCEAVVGSGSPLYCGGLWCFINCHSLRGNNEVINVTNKHPGYLCDSEGQ